MTVFLLWWFSIYALKLTAKPLSLVCSRQTHAQNSAPLDNYRVPSVLHMSPANYAHVCQRNRPLFLCSAWAKVSLLSLQRLAAQMNYPLCKRRLDITFLIEYTNNMGFPQRDCFGSYAAALFDSPWGLYQKNIILLSTFSSMVRMSWHRSQIRSCPSPCWHCWQYSTLRLFIRAWVTQRSAHLSLILRCAL